MQKSWRFTGELKKDSSSLEDKKAAGREGSTDWEWSNSPSSTTTTEVPLSKVPAVEQLPFYGAA